jgi:hypothetical protein
MLWMLLPTQAQSEPQDPLDLLWEEISSTIQPDQYYEGSLVKDAMWELILAADRAIVQASDDAAEAAAAEVTRQLLPELEGYKAGYEAAQLQLQRGKWVTVAVGLGMFIAGALIVSAF